MAAIFDLEKIFHGKTFILPVTFVDDDLTGADISFLLEEYTEETEGVDIDDSDLANGKFTVTVSSELMLALEADEIYYPWLKVVYATGHVEILKGSFYLEKAGIE